MNWNTMAATKMLPSLGGHLLFGLITALAYTWLHRRAMEKFGRTSYRAISST